MAKKPYAHMTRCINGTTIIRIPPGADYPLPESVRRVMRAAIAWQHSGHVTGLCMAATTKLSKAIDAYERATKAKGK
jgi:hypothetical protein